MASRRRYLSPAVRSETGWTGLFWDAFKQSRNAMVLLDPQRRLVEVNGAFVALSGYPRSALIGRPLYDFLAHGRPTHSDREWEEALRKPEFTGVSELVRADGERTRVNFAGYPEVVTGRQMVLGVAVQTVRATGRSASKVTRDPASVDLSGREREVVEMIARGMSGPEIAQELHLAHNTVRTHVRNSMAKTGARSRAHLVAMSLGKGLLWDQRGAAAAEAAS
jgi:PAS domain S-box-containing protein